MINYHYTSKVILQRSTKNFYGEDCFLQACYFSISERLKNPSIPEIIIETKTPYNDVGKLISYENRDIEQWKELYNTYILYNGLI